MPNRRKARENAFIALFSTAFGNTMPEALENACEGDEELNLDDFGRTLLGLYEAHSQEIDAAIEGKLKGWNVNRLSKVNLSILRLAVAEMLYGKEDMDSVVINEAVELAKRFGDESDYQFVNGLLGALSRDEGNHQNDTASGGAGV